MLLPHFYVSILCIYTALWLIFIHITNLSSKAVKNGSLHSSRSSGLPLPNPVSELERIVNDLKVNYKTYVVEFDVERVS